MFIFCLYSDASDVKEMINMSFASFFMVSLIEVFIADFAVGDASEATESTFVSLLSLSVLQYLFLQHLFFSSHITENIKKVSALLKLSIFSLLP